MAENEGIQNIKKILGAASSIQRWVDDNDLSEHSKNLKDKNIVLYDAMVTDDSLKDVTETLFRQGHYALAVEEAYKFLNNLVKIRSGLLLDGADLMRAVFSANNPILTINSFKTLSQKDQQRGYMDILAGCMTGIRNPRAHEHKYLDSPQPALEMLSLANHLIITIKESKKIGIKKRKSP